MVSEQPESGAVKLVNLDVGKSCVTFLSIYFSLEEGSTAVPVDHYCNRSGRQSAHIGTWCRFIPSGFFLL